MKQMDFVRAALRGRSEELVRSRSSRWEVWTRKAAGRRTANGELQVVETETYWLLSKKGFGMRVGKTAKADGSVCVKKEVVEALILEGRHLLGKDHILTDILSTEEQAEQEAIEEMRGE